MKHFHIILVIWYRSAAEEWVRLKLFHLCQKDVKYLQETFEATDCADDTVCVRGWEQESKV